MGNCNTCQFKAKCLLKRLYDEQIVRITRALDADGNPISVFNMTSAGLPYLEVDSTWTAEDIATKVAQFKAGLQTKAYELIGSVCTAYVAQA